VRIHPSIIVFALVLSACSGGGGGTPGAIPAAQRPSTNGSGGASPATPHFTIVDLGAKIFPRHINDAGTVVGNVDSGPAFAWSAGSLVTLAPLATYTTAVAYWINDSGESVGTSFGNNSAFRATRWNASGSAVDLGVPSNYAYSGAFSVNARGAIVGYSEQSGFNGPAAFTDEIVSFDGSGTASGYPSNATAYGGRAYAINDAGEISGVFCCPYGAPDTGTQAITDPPYTVLMMPANSGDGAGAVDLNAQGNVVGWYAGGPFHRGNPVCCGFYEIGGVVTEIDDPSGNGFLIANAINANNLIVGTYGNADVSQARAFLYTGKVVDLNTLIPPCNWMLNDATSVNGRGQIVGVGTLGGVTHGFLLNPSQ
jgi:hypothetical protein